MKTNVLVKDFLKEVFATKTRFISIMLIVALGAGFFAGVKATEDDMKLTMNKFLNDNNYMDVEVISTLGISDNDLEALYNQPNIEKVVPAYQLDALIKTEENTSVVRIHSYSDDPDTLNKFQLVSGRLPEKPNEILVEDLRSPSGSLSDQLLQIGKTIKFSSGTKDPLTDFINREEYTVVGTITSSMYFADTKGYSSIGSGTVAYFMYLPDNEFCMEAYASANIKLNNTDGLDTYSEEYKQITQNAKTSLEQLATVREPLRLVEVKEEPEQEIKDAEIELKEETDKNQKKIDDAKIELADAEKKIADGEIELIDAEKEFDDAIVDAEIKIADAEIELIDAEKKYDDGVIEYNDGLKEYEDGKKEFEKEYPKAIKELEDAQKELDKAEKLLNDAWLQLEQGNFELELNKVKLAELEAAAQLTGDPTLTGQAQFMKQQLGKAELELANGSIEHIQGTVELEEGKKKLLEGWQELKDAEQELNDAKIKLDDAKIEIEDARIKIDDGKKELEDAKIELEDAKIDGEVKISDAKIEIDDGKKELEDAKIKLEDSEKEFLEKVEEAEIELEDAKQKLNDIEEAEWIITKRDEREDVRGLGDNADRIDKIANIFPMFFMLIAALVCMTTMSRMVEDQRIQIGTLKAMGYSQPAVAAKFVVYALLASSLGSLLGLVIGFKLFPTVIFEAYNAFEYRLPSAITVFHMDLALSTGITSVVATILVTLYTCLSYLRSEPASLLRPAAPKAGKRILLERINIIWKNLSFSWKVTCRNLFRYKKRMLMTIIGISGCTALLVAGFGLRDAVSGVVETHFSQVFLYDMAIVVDENASNTKHTINEIEQEKIITESISLSAVNGKATIPEYNSYDVVMYITDDKDHLKTFVNMHERVSQEPLELTDDGVVISEKLAKLLDISVGDTILIDNDKREENVIVTGIMENYIFHHVMMTKDYYSKIFEARPKINRVFAMVDDQSKQDKTVLDETAISIIENEDILTVSITKTIFDMIKDQMKSLDTVVQVLVISAGLLAFIVMYNLTNINIMEREREIATIKVLGFFEKETSSYVYRENMILSIMGAIAGLFMGVVLTKFVTSSAEVDNMMFGQQIKPQTFVFAFALTIFFTLLVRFVISFRLKKIDMIEALKSVE